LTGEQNRWQRASGRAGGEGGKRERRGGGN